jgi:hypothetical protein
MGKTSAEIEREIAAHREAVSRKRERLEERVRTDVHDARVAVSDEVLSRTKIGEYARERPLMTLAAAFGAGVLLGNITDPGAANGPQPAAQRGPRDHGAGRDGLLGALLGSVTTPLGGALHDEVRDLVRDVFRRDEMSTSTATRESQPAQQEFSM